MKTQELTLNEFLSIKQKIDNLQTKSEEILQIFNNQTKIMKFIKNMN